MKLLLFKSKTCGPCKMFEPQVKIAGETLNIEYIPIDVEENQTFNLWKNITTVELIEKFVVVSSGKLVFLLDETKEDGPTIMWERPTAAKDIIKSIEPMINAAE